MTFDDIFQRFASANAFVPGKKVKFDFGADQKIVLDGVANSVTRDDGEANTTLQLSLEDFLSMAEGKLDPTMAFMQGKLKVLGDMGVAMQLQGVMKKLQG